MSEKKLPLLEWQPACKVLVFPLDARVGKVRRTASLLYKKQGEDADLYWKQVIAANRKHLIRIGLTAEEQHEQLSGFSCAVQQELNTIAKLCGGGAA
ncbi:DUF6074 family protein [Ochrobactrum sp. SFR4]|uniref:DUF6074 family protein n=1 Tax=Ochrobactrum sp. SFR4 TaxID=2717368 RepID=UPI001C8C3A46|nr:DUF6074 family protein [Ochrobactrum sp. SFR4]MBX8826887.1 hypothetical protein [Ochrobactrum sp. SFR4]